MPEVQKTILLYFFALLLFAGCASAQPASFNAVVQQSAGSGLKATALEHAGERSVQEMLYSDEDVMLYLPWPANRAVISGTDIPVLILSPAIRSGTELEILPIALLELSDRDSTSQLLLSIPRSPSLQVIKSPTLQQLELNYPGVIEILTLWLTNAFEDQFLEVVSVQDENQALQFLNERL